ncbi:MAG: hypothetical protein RSC60_03715 [Christensenellaceae bacterium]
MENIEINNVRTDAKATIISFKMKRREHICPACGGATDQVHD